jgi:hypothetical protein
VILISAGVGVYKKSEKKYTRADSNRFIYLPWYRTNELIPKEDWFRIGTRRQLERDCQQGCIVSSKYIRGWGTEEVYDPNNVHFLLSLTHPWQLKKLNEQYFIYNPSLPPELLTH